MLRVGWCRLGRWSELPVELMFKRRPAIRFGLQLGGKLTPNIVRKGTQEACFSTHALRRSQPIHESRTRGLINCRNFSQGTEDDFNLARDAVQHHALTKGDKTCLLFTDGVSSRREVSYRQLFEASVHLATALSDATKTGPPKLALVVVPKILPWWVINVAASWCGIIVSPGTSLLRRKDLEYRLSKSEADCVFCTPTLVPEMDEAEKNLGKQGQLLKVVIGAPRNLEMSGWVKYEDLLSTGASLPPMPYRPTLPTDTCQMFFTSGTTGNPKMVPHSHTSYGRGHQYSISNWLDLKEEDVLLNVSDTGWAKAAWSSLYIPLIAGATAFVHQMERFEPAVLLEALQTEAISVMCAPPTAYRTLVQMPLQDYTFRSLRHCVSAGEPLNPEVIQTWTAKTGITIYEGYGQTETTLMCATVPGMEIRSGSMGKPTPDYDVRILDSNMQEVPTGQEGLIGVRTEPSYPNGLFRGYHADPEKNRAAFRGGYYLTGDLGRLDQDGYLWFVSRDDDIIISSGYRIGPFEVESTLLEHPSVVESAVVGIPDQQRGHIVKAFVVLSDEVATKIEGCDDEREKLIGELQTHVKTVTAPYKYPRQIEFVRSLPKTVSGKIRRMELRQRSPQAGGTGTAS